MYAASVRNEHSGVQAEFRLQERLVQVEGDRCDRFRLERRQLAVYNVDEGKKGVRSPEQLQKESKNQYVVRKKKNIATNLFVLPQRFGGLEDGKRVDTTCCGGDDENWHGLSRDKAHIRGGHVFERIFRQERKGGLEKGLP